MQSVKTLLSGQLAVMRTGSSQFSSYMTDHLFLSQSQRKVQTMLSSMISPVKTEVQRITEYLSTQNPLPQYLPYARFLLSADLTHTAKLLYTLLLDRATLSQKNNWVDRANTKSLHNPAQPPKKPHKSLICGPECPEGRTTHETDQMPF